MWIDLASDIADTFELLSSCVDKFESSLTYHAASDDQSPHRKAYMRAWAKQNYAKNAEYRASKSQSDRLRYLRKKQTEALAKAMLDARAVAA